MTGLRIFFPNIRKISHRPLFFIWTHESRDREALLTPYAFSSIDDRGSSGRRSTYLDESRPVGQGQGSHTKK